MSASLPRRDRSRRAIWFTLAAVLLSPSLHAAASTQNSFFQNASLAATSNYTSGATPTNTQDILLTTSATSLTLTAASRNYGSLDATNGTAYTISNSTTGATNSTITLGGGGTTNGISGASGTDLIYLSGNSNVTLNGPNSSTGSGALTVALAAAGSFDASTGSTLAVSSAISGAFDLTKSGAGTLTLSGTNTFGGAGKSFTLGAGTLNLNSAAALGSSANTFVIGGGTLNNTSGGALTTSNYAQTWTGDFTFTGSNSLNLGTGAVALGASRQVTVNASTLTVGGVVSGSGFSLTKAGAGALVLAGNNTFSGGLTISGGTLTASHNHALGAGSVTIGSSGTLLVGNGITLANDITVTGILTGSASSSTFTGIIRGVGTLGGTMTIGSGGTISPGNSPGILANSALLTFASGSTYSWELANLSTSGAGTNFDEISNTGAITLESGTTLAPFITGSTPGTDPFWNSDRTWTVISSSGGGTISGSPFVVSNSYAAYGTFSTALTGNDLTLTWTATSSAIPEPSTYAAWTALAVLARAWWRRRQPVRFERN